MLALPPVAPVTGWRWSTRLPRDHYIRMDSNDYSIHPSVIGRRIEIAAGLGRFQAFCDGRLVADHERIWAKHQTLTDPAHAAAGKALRQQRFTVAKPPAEHDVQLRCLDDYDALLGVDGGAA